MCTQRRLKLACLSVQSDLSLLSACRNYTSLAIQNAPKEGFDQIANAQADLNLHWVHMYKDTFSDVICDNGEIKKKKRFCLLFI